MAHGFAGGCSQAGGQACGHQSSQDSAGVEESLSKLTHIAVASLSLLLLAGGFGGMGDSPGCSCGVAGFPWSETAGRVGWEEHPSW